MMSGSRDLSNYPPGYEAYFPTNYTPFINPLLINDVLSLCENAARQSGPQSVRTLFNMSLKDRIDTEVECWLNYIQSQVNSNLTVPRQPGLPPRLSISTQASSSVAGGYTDADTYTTASSVHGAAGGVLKPPPSLYGGSHASVGTRGKGQNNGGLQCPSCYQILSSENTAARRHIRTCVKALVCKHCKIYRTGDKTRFSKHEESCGKPNGGEKGKKHHNKGARMRPIADMCKKMCDKVCETGMSISVMIEQINYHYNVDGCSDPSCRRFSRHTASQQHQTMQQQQNAPVQQTPSPSIQIRQPTMDAFSSSEVGHVGGWTTDRELSNYSIQQATTNQMPHSPLLSPINTDVASIHNFSQPSSPHTYNTTLTPNTFIAEPEDIAFSQEPDFNFIADHFNYGDSMDTRMG